MTIPPWISSYEPEIKPRLDYPSVALTDLLQQAAEQFPDRDALFFMGKRLSYQKLLDAAYRFANALIRLGVGRGDRVALSLPNVPQYVICYYGVLFMGGIVVQTNPLYTERELVRQLTDSGAKTIVCLDLVYPRVKKACRTVTLNNVIVTGIQDYLPFPKNVLYPLVQKKKGAVSRTDDSSSDYFISLKKLLARSSPEPVRTDIDLSEDIAVLQYTGGTTGTAKGVMLTHANLVANVIQCAAWIHRVRKGEETMLAAVPLFHVYGMTVCMNLGIYLAARILLVPKFDADQLLKLIHGEKPTLFPGAPTMYIAIIHHPRLDSYNLSSINYCISGSAPLPLKVQQTFEKLTGGKLVEGYGLSEAAPVTHANPIWGRRVEGSIGIPWPDTEALIMQENGEAAAPGQIGELLVKGPQVMKGYWNQPAETEAVLKEGWLATGDMGYMDTDGYFYIVDRKKEMINASGLKVYPREVEEVLYQHPAVQEAAVIGIPDEYRGETVKAFVVLRGDQQVSDQQLDQFCRERLASYKVPRAYEYRSELPKTMVGKVLRRALAEEERNKQGT
ncbi:long-chain fatty acid--CoA ligase [Paenibacillus sp. J2TS4]|uniref:long-chain-fatty-acid--CoA ligase n=1 Tax=Paenibacillus sp. J2TS4 TaxID=2807194 RepID=UPI001B1C57C9|nr:long-chain fatty acid--CoA ligase [Paenibacillus sp. J2TS4]GIP32755.1 long-chain-fatty-acid--CoA ligase [Paenibacillus sp. J2TS4]